MFDAIASTIEHIKADQLCPLAVTTASQSVLLPETPIMSDFVPGYEVTNWFGLGMPKNTPAEIIDRLNIAVNEGLADSKLKRRLAGLGEHAARLPCRFWQAHRRRNREVGQGDPNGQYQAGVTACSSNRGSMTSRYADRSDLSRRADIYQPHDGGTALRRRP